MFKINDIDFNIKYAYLDAFVNEDDELLNIGIKIETEKNNFIGYNVKIDSEIILKIKPKILNEWQDIIESKIEWNKFPENGSKKPYAFLIIEEHEEIYNAKIEFKKINNKIFVKIIANVNIQYENNYMENVILEIETEIDFFILFCGNTEEKNCRKEHEQYLSVMDYKYYKTILDVSILLPNDVNMEKLKLVFGENYIV